MNLTGKQRDLLELFLNNSGYLPVKQLTLILEVSDKTLRSMVKKLNDELKGLHAQIVLKRGSGYKLESDNLPLVRQTVREFQGEEDPLPQEIFLRMIDRRDYITVDALCEELFVGKSKLHGALVELRRQLQPFGLEIATRPHYGMRIDGEELGKRLAIATLSGTERYPGADLKPSISGIVVEEMKKRNLSCSDVVLENLLTQIEIALKRSQQGFTIELEPAGETAAEAGSELANVIVERLESSLGTLFPISEKDYLQSYLSGQAAAIQESGLREDKVRINMIIDAFLQRIEQIYDVSLWHDRKLRSGLLFHLDPLIERLSRGVHLKNPILKEIKQQFPFAFNLAALLAEEIVRIYREPLNDDDIAYLTMHIGLALERQLNQPRGRFDRIAIVCTTGQGTAELLKFKIERTFPQTHHIEAFSLFNKEQVLKFRPDVIFSTVPVEIGDIPVEIISPFFTEEDRDKLVAYRKRKEKEVLIERYFSEDLFYAPLSAKVREEAIHEMCKKIEWTGITPPNFEELCLIREKLASTAFGGLIALVHPIELCATVTKVGVGILKKQIDWEGMPVKIVFVIAQASGSESRDLLLLIQEIVHDPRLMTKLCEAGSFDEFKNELLGSV